jgi:murein L,D-transpeptidase YcbB/YkuD
MVVTAGLVTLSTTAASAATTAYAPGHVTARAAAAADPSGCVTEDFSIADEPYYEPFVADEQILLNDIWYYDQSSNEYSGVNQLLTVDGSYRPHTTSDVKAFQSWWGDIVDGITGPMTWDSLCSVDHELGYTGVYWHDVGCATEPGL